MKTTRKFSLVAAIALTLAAATHAADYQLIKTIPVGGDGGWDYLTVDSAARRLYVSHATKVVVIDLDKDKAIGEITNTPGVHGIAIAPELNRGFASCGRENKAAIVDLKTLQVISKVDTGKNPDGMLYDPAQQEVYMFNGGSQSATVIDAKTGKVITTIPLGGRPEFAQVDTEVHRVYLNIEDKNEVIAIDTQTHKVVNHWPIAPGEEASGMAFDQKNHRLFLGCGGSKLMAMMDSTSGKVIASVPIGDGVDANAFDAATQLAFASCSDGTVTIAHEDGDKLVVVQTLKTARGARTMTIDPLTHRIYLGAAEYEASTNAPAASSKRPRPKMVAGSFKILVFGSDPK